MHTPDFEAIKCWSGNMGSIATHAVVYAQLYTADGKCHGLHTFVVPIRDLYTHTAFSGVIVGDMGKKLGQNGLANGYVCTYVFNMVVIKRYYHLVGCTCLSS